MTPTTKKDDIGRVIDKISIDGGKRDREIMDIRNSHFEFMKETNENLVEIKNALVKQGVVLEAHMKTEDKDREELKERLDRMFQKIEHIDSKKLDRWVFVWVIGGLVGAAIIAFSVIGTDIKDVKTALGWYEIKIPNPR